MELSLRGLYQPTVLLAMALMAVIAMMILPMPAWILDLGLAASFAHRDPDLHHHPLHPAAARLLGLPDDPARLADAAAVAQRLLDQADHRPGPHRHQGRRARDRGLRHVHHGRLGLPRPRRLRRAPDRQLHRHHQGRRPHGRGRRPLRPRRHARQAARHRQRHGGGRHLPRRGARAAADRAGGDHLLRLARRRLEVRQGRRGRRPADHAPQPGDGPRDGRAGARHADPRRLRDLFDPDRRRRPGHPDPGGDHLDRQRHAALQGRAGRLDRPGADPPARRLPDGARDRGGADGALRLHPRACRSCRS